MSKRSEQRKKNIHTQVLHVTPMMVFSSFVRFSFDCVCLDLSRLTHISIHDSSSNNNDNDNDTNHSGFMLFQTNTTDKMPLIHFLWLEKSVFFYFVKINAIRAFRFAYVLFSADYNRKLHTIRDRASERERVAELDR